MKHGVTPLTRQESSSEACTGPFLSDNIPTQYFTQRQAHILPPPISLSLIYKRPLPIYLRIEILHAHSRQFPTSKISLQLPPLRLNYAMSDNFESKIVFGEADNKATNDSSILLCKCTSNSTLAINSRASTAKPFHSN